MRKDFTGTFCDFYFVAVAAALPLYTRGRMRFWVIPSTLLFFLLLGICESVVRRQENERSAAERGEDRSVAL